jgi:Mce-associated membrane protein
MSVSLYDLLDVDEHATPEQIRSAWKVAIADLDPNDRRFRAYNGAAGELLDPGKREVYDAELAAGRDEPEPDTDSVAGPVVVEQVDAPVDAPADAPAAAPDTPVATAADTASSGPPTWALLVAAGAAVLSIALLVVVSSWPGSWGDPSPEEQAESADEAEAAGATAVDAPDAAVPAVLSYDYRTLDADFAEAESYLTDDFAAKRSALFEQQAESGMTLREQVVSDKVVVTARTSGTGLTRVSEDGDRATVVVYVDQDSQKGKDAPRSLRMWATLSMVADGDDWLLDDICTEDDCS